MSAKTPRYPAIYQFAKMMAQISHEEWEIMESTFQEQKFQRGQFLTEPGKSPDNVYFVLEGVARSYFVNNTGREYTRIFRGPGNLMASYSEALMGTPTRYFIQATTDLKVVHFSFKTFLELMSQFHAWERLGRAIAERNYLEKERREYMLIHMDIAEKYAEFLVDFAPFWQLIPQYQIASYMGVSAESLNRYLAKRPE